MKRKTMETNEGNQWPFRREYSFAFDSIYQSISVVTTAKNK